MDAVILVGGLGIRLRPLLINKPKCLMSINGKPFIDILLDYCIDQGLRRFILCVCYRKEQVIEHLRNRNDCKIIFSEEDKPLGTGGATGRGVAARGAGAGAKVAPGPTIAGPN